MTKLRPPMPDPLDADDLTPYIVRLLLVGPKLAGPLPVPLTAQDRASIQKLRKPLVAATTWRAHRDRLLELSGSTPRRWPGRQFWAEQISYGASGLRAASEKPLASGFSSLSEFVEEV